MKSLEPYQKKLGTDTWFYTKRCFLALFENMAKHLTILKDSFIAELIQFFTHCESKSCFISQTFKLLFYFHFILVYGKDVKGKDIKFCC